MSDMHYDGSHYAHVAHRASRQEQKKERRARRLERYEQVMALYQTGTSIQGIMR